MAANRSLVPAGSGLPRRTDVLEWGTDDRAKRGPCDGAWFAAWRRTGHWCLQARDCQDERTCSNGAPMTERSEVHVTVRGSPHGGEPVIGACRLGTAKTNGRSRMGHR